jgi:hypothetical protein
MNYLKVNIVICLLIGVASCNLINKSKTEYKVLSLDSTLQTTKISIKNLTKNYKSYQGIYIETEGIFYDEFENVSICINRGRDIKCFWLRFNDSLLKDFSLLMKSSTKRVTLKGVVDTSSKGHLSSYLATIKNVYYFKEE